MLRGYENVNNKLQCMSVPMHAHVQMLVEVREVVFSQPVSSHFFKTNSFAEPEAH